jgi:histone-lysine N-methyltransferase SETMAR
MPVPLGDMLPCCPTVKSWVAIFRTGRLSTEDEERFRCPTRVDPENVDAIHCIILDDREISAKKIAETLTISRERVDCIIDEILYMIKLSTKWVSKCLNAVQKRDRVHASQAILDRFRQEPVGFFNPLVTVEETCIYISSRDQGTMRGTATAVLLFQISLRRRSHQGVSVCLLEQRWNFASKLPGKGCNHHGTVRRCTVDKQKQQLVTKRRTKLSKGISFLLDNVVPHKATITHHKFADFRYEVLKHLDYSPDSAPSDYYAFPNLKKYFKGRKFSSIEEATLATDGWFAAQPKSFFLDC